MKNWQDIEKWYRVNGFLAAASNMEEIKWDRTTDSVAGSIAAHEAVKTCLQPNLRAQRKHNAKWGVKTRPPIYVNLPAVARAEVRA